jgi:hypothetical protein
MPQPIEMEDFRHEAAKLFNAARCMDRLIKSPGFVEAFEYMTVGEKVIARLCITNLKCEPLRHLIARKLDERPLESKSLRALRRNASALGISYYSRLPRSELIRAIEEMKCEKQI